MKIAVIGYSGSGKSTFARTLGKKLNIPVLHLDTVQFTAGWQERNLNEGQEIVKQFMQQNKNWIIDGNYKKFFRAERLQQADKIVFFNFPALKCVYQALCRYFKYRGTTRADMADGCNEKFDYEFFKWIIKDSRTPERKNVYKEICARYPEKILICRNKKERELSEKMILCDYK